MKKIVLGLFFCAFVILAGCFDGDRAALVNWTQDLDTEQTEAFFWAQENDRAEIELTPEEERKLISILNDLTEDNITWNKCLAGITPEYGFHLAVGDDERYINQAEAPYGQTETNFHGKQWWIESAELFEFMKAFLDAS